MRQKNDGEYVCGHCGYDERTYHIRPYVLPPYTILNGKYMLGKVLGAGGFGITYIALDLRLERTVAIKEYFVQGTMYRNSAETVQVTTTASSVEADKIFRANMEKFESEAKTLAGLDDMPGIVRVYDFFRENNTLYMVLEYLSGMTLERYVQKNGGKLSWNEVTEMLSPAMESLQRLHEMGIIHRDISPDNMMVLDTPNHQNEIKLFDFGGARTAGKGKHSSIALKKYGYSPIEQTASTEQQGPWTDVYAMAATIYYCICGEAPLDAAERVTTPDLFVPPSERKVKISSKQEAALLKGLGLRPADRYASMEVFRLSILGLPLTTEKRKKTSQPVLKKTPVKNKGIEKGKKVRKAVIALLLILALAGGAGYYYLTSREDHKEWELHVANGTGSGHFTEGTATAIAAQSEREGLQFDHWQIVEGDAVIEDASQAQTILTMGDGAVQIEAVYQEPETADAEVQNQTDENKPDQPDSNKETETDKAKETEKETKTDKETQKETAPENAAAEETEQKEPDSEKETVSREAASEKPEEKETVSEESETAKPVQVTTFKYVKNAPGAVAYVKKYIEEDVSYRYPRTAPMESYDNLTVYALKESQVTAMYFCYDAKLYGIETPYPTWELFTDEDLSLADPDETTEEVDDIKAVLKEQDERREAAMTKEPLLREYDSFLNDNTKTTPVLITGSGVRVREEPQTGGKELGTLDRWSKLQRILTLDNNWAMVVYDGTIGYCSGNYLVVEGSEEEEAKRKELESQSSGSSSEGTVYSGQWDTYYYDYTPSYTPSDTTTTTTSGGGDNISGWVVVN